MLITLLAVTLAGPLPPAPVRLGTDRLRHGGTVRALAVHPDGRLLASAGHDRLIALWDLPQGTLAGEGSGHEADITGLAWSPDGKLLASGAGDGTVRLWDRRGQSLHTLETKSDSVSVVAWSPDGRTLAAGLDNGVALIDPTTAKQTALLTAPEAVRALAWSPDGKLLAVNGGDKAVALLDRATGKSRSFGGDSVYILAWAGKRLAGWSPDVGVRLFDPAKGAVEQTWDTSPGVPTAGGATGMVYQMSVEGDRVAIGTVDGAVLLFRAGEAKPIARATGHHGRVPAVQFAGKWLVSAGADSTVRLWDARTLKPLSPASPLDQPVADVAIAGGQWHVQFADGSVRVYDRATGKWGEKSTPAERRLTARDRVYSLDLVKNELRRGEKTLAKGIRTLTLSEDGSTLLTRDDAGGLNVRDADGKALRTLVNVEKNQQLFLSPRGTYFLGLTGSIQIALARTADGKVRHVLSGHRGGTRVAAFTPDERWLITGGRDRMVRFWDVDTGLPRLSPRGSEAEITALACDPRGQIVAIGTREGVVQLRAVRTGELLREAALHRGPVTVLRWDRRLLLSAGVDTTVRLWDLTGLTPNRPARITLTTGERDKFWQTLRETDAARASAAMEKLQSDGDPVIELVRRDVPPIDPKAANQWLAELDDEDFMKREKAFQRLLTYGPLLERMLRKRLEEKPSLELARRIDRLLKAIESAPSESHLQQLRAVELLEGIGTPEALKLLETLAGGAADAELTVRARAAADRLRRR